ncbi:MAG: ComEC/Rec2 family competence protein, partial [Pseudomonadota bacterium]
MKLIDKINGIIEAEHSRFILWIPVFTAAGIVFYFNLQNEPPFYLPIALTISGSIFVTALLLLKNHLKQIFLIPAIISLCFFAGIMFAQIRTNTVDSPYLEKSLPIQNIRGKILEITQTPKGSKIILKDVYIPDIPQEKTPKLVSVSLKTYDPNLLNGQIISLRAGLFPPPAPSLAGGFDFSRYFYFKQIGAIGFGITPIKIIPQDANSRENFDVRFAEFRHKLSESIRANFKEPGGSIAAAFITGETRTIPDNINDNMRIAG